MRKLHREPTIKNKYELDAKKIYSLKVGKLDSLEKYGFWRNEVLGAWCYIVKLGDTDIFHDNTFWIGIYDKEVSRLNYGYKESKFRKKKTRINFKFYVYGDSVEQYITKFYRPADIKNEFDLVIQEKFLEAMNNLIDNKILYF